jgi:NTE family protein
MRVGLVLDGGGEVGVAWEIGVLAALEHDAGFNPSTSTVIAGTSAGAAVGAYVAQGRAMSELVELERSGQVARIGAAPGAASRDIPPDIIAALMSTEGTFEERAAHLGKLAQEAPVDLDQATFVGGFQEILGTSDWPSAANSGSGVDRVSVFLGNRNAGGLWLGDALLNSGGANAWQATVSLPTNNTGAPSLFVYAHSSVTGQQSIVSIPVTISIS